MPKPKRLTYRELRKKVKPYGIEEIKKRGKGSERMLYQASTGFNYPIKCHGENDQLSIGLLNAVVRRFNLPEDFLF